MIYMVTCSFSDPSREAEWSEWYSGHLNTLLTVPGIHTAQRFRAVTECPYRYIAMYTNDGMGVFTGEGYRGIGGGRFNDTWQPYIRNWNRNLFEGERAPDVAPGQYVAVYDTEAPVEVAGAEFTWLKVADMDKSTPYRGYAIVDRETGEALVRDNDGMALFEALTEQRQSVD